MVTAAQLCAYAPETLNCILENGCTGDFHYMNFIFEKIRPGTISVKRIEGDKIYELIWGPGCMMLNVRSGD